MKKGWVAIQVGLEEEGEKVKKFGIPISYLYHPLLQELLDKAREVYGYQKDGPLRLPCSVDDFIHLRWQIERERNVSMNKHGNHHLHHHHFHHLPTSISFHSC
ncbi:hypothetical protein LIER_17818 [Lithospermum erythrorhizon]|uniref:SAUR family protein n=1 Tax=Lithospermum erythrorhizon TaxID=34254 RepID=A0AAV3QE78_LITER